MVTISPGKVIGYGGAYLFFNDNGNLVRSYNTTKDYPIQLIAYVTGCNFKPKGIDLIINHDNKVSTTTFNNPNLNCVTFDNAGSYKFVTTIKPSTVGTYSFKEKWIEQEPFFTNETVLKLNTTKTTTVSSTYSVNLSFVNKNGEWVTNYTTTDTKITLVGYGIYPKCSPKPSKIKLQVEYNTSTTTMPLSPNVYCTTQTLSGYSVIYSPYILNSLKRGKYKFKEIWIENGVPNTTNTAVLKVNTLNTTTSTTSTTQYPLPIKFSWEKALPIIVLTGIGILSMGVYVITRK